MTAYPEIEDALQVVDRYGFHIRDIGLLASALARPATTVMGVEAYPQLAMKAAALMESVARFYPLIDGNKRTAWTLMILMLWINGYRHDFDTDAAFNLVVGLQPAMSRNPSIHAFSALKELRSFILECSDRSARSERSFGALRRTDSGVLSMSTDLDLQGALAGPVAWVRGLAPGPGGQPNLPAGKIVLEDPSVGRPAGQV